MSAPLERLNALLPPHIRRVTERETSIPTIAQRAARAHASGTAITRCDIGQIVGVHPEREVLYGPPVGLTEMRAAIAELYTRSFRFDTPLGADNVAMCTGAAEALSILFRCFGYRKDVGLPRGHWENYTNAVDLAQGTVHLIDYFDADGRFRPEALAAQIREASLSALVANFPCNPTGAVLDQEETEALARVVVDTGVVLMADEVYARLRYDGEPAHSLLRHAPNHVVSLGSASKEYLLPGARVGYVVSTNTDLIGRVLRRLIRASSASPNVLGQRELLVRLEPDLEDMRAGRPPTLLCEIRDAMERRKSALMAVLQKHGMAPAGREPAGTIFLMASLPAWWEGDDASFCETALAAGRFSSIPGSAFGLPGAFRLSFGALTEAGIEALDTHFSAMAAERA